MKLSFHSLILAIIMILSFSSSGITSITGTVTDTQGSPVSGALVAFTNESDPEQTYSMYTHESGYYEVDIQPISVDEDTSQPFSLGQNYPNPFNPTTAIFFSLNTSAHVNLSIFNIMDQKVKNIIDHKMNPGHHAVTWDGMDEHGYHVGAGIYLYQFRSDCHTQTRIMLLLDSGNISGGESNTI